MRGNIVSSAESKDKTPSLYASTNLDFPLLAHKPGVLGALRLSHSQGQTDKIKLLTTEVH